MATPTGVRADQARAWYARERRRTKQNQKAFDIVGLVNKLGIDLVFGIVPPGGSSPYDITLPADATFTLKINAATNAGDIGIQDVISGIVYWSAENIPANGSVNIRHLFRKSHQIRLVKSGGAPVGDIKIYFRGPKTELIEVGADPSLKFYAPNETSIVPTIGLPGTFTRNSGQNFVDDQNFYEIGRASCRERV